MLAENPQASDEYRRRICRAIDFINRNLASNPSMIEIARAAPFSSFHFQRLFHALMGETVADFTRRVRLETAARRLRFRSQDDITGTAFDLGFSSSQNFAKAFKKHFGVSPTQYREQAQDHRDDAPVSFQALDHSLSASESQTLELAKSVAVRELREARVVYRRHFGSYNDPGVQAAFDALARWAKPRGLDHFDRYLGIPWDDAEVTPANRCRFDACLIVPVAARLDGGINWQEIPAGRYAVHSCEVVQHDFDLPWTKLMRGWLPQSGYQPADGPRFESYHSDGSTDLAGRWRIDVCLPVVPL